MRWWQSRGDAEAAAREYAIVIHGALLESAQTKALTPQGVLQILGTLQARLTEGDAPRLAPKATLRLIGDLAVLISAVNAGLAEHEQGFLGQVERQLRDLARSEDE